MKLMLVLTGTLLLAAFCSGQRLADLAGKNRQAPVKARHVVNDENWKKSSGKVSPPPAKGPSATWHTQPSAPAPSFHGPAPSSSPESHAPGEPSEGEKKGARAAWDLVKKVHDDQEAKTKAKAKKR